MTEIKKGRKRLFNTDNMEIGDSLELIGVPFKFRFQYVRAFNLRGDAKFECCNIGGKLHVKRVS